MLKRIIFLFLAVILSGCYHYGARARFAAPIYNPGPVPGPVAPGPGPGPQAPNVPRPGPNQQSPEPPLASPNGGTAETQALIKAVQKVGGKSVNGQLDPKICSLQDQYVQKMARNNKQDGHAGFDRRMSEAGGSGGGEITSETFGYERGLQEAADSCVKGWLGSSGHREKLMAYHDRFCYSMAKGSSGKYFCSGQFANGGSGGGGGGSLSKGQPRQPRNQMARSGRRERSHQ